MTTVDLSALSDAKASNTKTFYVPQSLVHKVNRDKAAIKINTREPQPPVAPLADNPKKALSHIEITRVTEKTNGSSTNADNKVILISTNSGKTVKLLPKSSLILKKCDSQELKRLTEADNMNTFIWKKKSVAECSKSTDGSPRALQPTAERPPQRKLMFTSKMVKLTAEEKMAKPVPWKKYQRKEFVSAEVQAVAAARDAATQTEPDEPESDAPDIIPLVKYICDNQKYSASIDQSERDNLMMLSQNVMAHTGSPKSAGTQSRLKLFTDLRDCIICDQNGNLPLHAAVMDKNLEAVKRQCMVLAFRTSNINCENKEGLTPLQLAVVHNCDVSLVHVLIHYKSVPHLLDEAANNVLHLAVEYSGEDVLAALLDNCADLHKIIDGKNDDGVTALILAVTSERLGMVRLLLEHNADPNVQDEKSGQTALFHAVQNGLEDIANLLLEHRADPKVSTYTGINSQEAAKELNFPLKCTESRSAKRKVDASAGKPKRNKLL